jgi:NADH-quinone oxidoreductase subunit M
VAGAIYSWISDHLLSTVVFLPLVSLLPLMLIELVGAARSETAWRVYAFVVSLIGFVLSLEVWRRFDPAVGDMQMVEYTEWISNYGINYYLGIDGISLFLVVLTAFLLPVVLLASWRDIGKRVKQYVFFMMALQTGMLGAFLSLNLFLFYVFWEVMLIPMYFLIGIWGGPRRIYATMKFFIYTMVGSLLMLVGILVLVYLHFGNAGVLTFDYIGIAGGPGILDTGIATEGEPWWQTQFWLFMLFALAFAIKVPMFPFHTWLPDAHVEAPTAGSVVLAGVLLKLGTYGFVRYTLPLFPEATIQLAPFAFGLAIIGIIYGALVAMVQEDVKKLVAYSSVSHLGFVMLGLFALNAQGLEGAVLQMVNHGISTGALFLLVGMIYERRHVREISAFGGLARVMPVYAVFFLITTLSSIGLPMLNGFVGEFLILIGTFEVSPVATVFAAIGVILSAIYMLWMVRRVFFGPVVHDANRKLLDLCLREKVVLCVMVVPMIWIGIYPASFLRPMDSTVTTLVETMESRGADIAAYQGRQPAEEMHSPDEPVESIEGAAPPEAAKLPDLIGPVETTGHEGGHP